MANISSNLITSVAVSGILSAIIGSAAAGNFGGGSTGGTTGPTGPRGSIGPRGQTGQTGLNGETGPTGPAGTSSTTGATGPTGYTGYTGAAGSTTLSGLTDVNIVNPLNSQSLVYDTASVKWINRFLSASFAELRNLGNGVTFPPTLSLTTGDWVNVFTSYPPTLKSNDSSFPSSNWSINGGNTLQWINPTMTELFKITYSISLSPSNAGATYQIGLGLNGTIMALDDSICYVDIITNSVPVTFSSSMLVTLSPNDVLSVLIQKSSAGADATVAFFMCSLIATGCTSF